MTDKEPIYIGDDETSEYQEVKTSWWMWAAYLVVSAAFWFGLIECLWMVVKGMSR